MITEEFTRTLVAERRRDLVQVANSGRFARLARRVRRQRNPSDGHLQHPA
jgi:hypothetical protein